MFKPNPGQKSKDLFHPSITFAVYPMVGANYTGGRRNAAKARSKDTTGRLQRGHFSKQRLGILTNALRSRRPDQLPLTHCRPSVGAGNPNLTSNPRSASLISPSGYPTSAPTATVYDISLGHAKRDLAQKQLRLHQPARVDFHPHPNTDGPFLPPLQPGPSTPSDSPAVTPSESSNPLALTGKGEPNPAFSPQTLLLATTSAAGPSCATIPSQSHTLPQPSLRPEPAFGRGSLTEKQATPVTTGQPSKRRSKILDLIDISDREHILFLRLPRNPALSVSVRHHPTCFVVRCLSHPYIIHPINHTISVHTRIPHSQSIPFPDRRSCDDTSMKQVDDNGYRPFPGVQSEPCVSIMPFLVSPLIPPKSLTPSPNYMFFPRFTSFADHCSTRSGFRSSPDRQDTCFPKLARRFPLRRSSESLPPSRYR